MSVRLAENQYGKARVRFAKIIRDQEHHTFRELTVRVALRGDFNDAHQKGDNSNVLPTDTMKNTVFALGQAHPLDTIESFARDLARHFVQSTTPVQSAEVSIAESLWNRIDADEAPHPHAFIRGGGELATCTVQVSSEVESVTSGVRHLVLLKTTDSAFSGYLKDRFTTLKETRDRIMASSIDASWPYPDTEVDFGNCRRQIRQAMINAFMHHQSESVQHTLFEMGRACLDACDCIPKISLTMPNLHYLPVDLAPLGISGPSDVFLPIDEPHGLIEATIVRE